MDVTTYLKINKPGLKMPKPDPVTGRDNLGIRYQGPVLTGKLGVEEQLERQAVSLPNTSALIRELAPGGIRYLPPTPHNLQPTSYNPSSDPVLRHHLNLPPLPDPDEQRRRASEALRKRQEEGQLDAA